MRLPWSDALYQLGLIAFNNKDIGLATETWSLLIKVVTEFPRTDAAKKAMSYRFMLYKDGMEAYWKGRQLLFDVLMGKKDALGEKRSLVGTCYGGGAFVEDFPGDAVAHIMELQIAQEYHIEVKLIATWFGELEGMNLGIARQNSSTCR